MASTPAGADTITLNLIDGDWAHPIGGTDVLISPGATPGAPDSISWGTKNRSGYIWDATDTTIAVDAGAKFSLGEFTHINQRIDPGTGLSGVDLLFTVGDFDSPTTLTATFHFLHDETPNPAADVVAITDESFTDPFTYNGTDYYFSLLGFSTDGGVTTTNNYLTGENGTNTADLYAVILKAPGLEPNVPEPASILLVGLGLGAAGLIRRRSKK